MLFRSTVCALDKDKKVASVKGATEATSSTPAKDNVSATFYGPPALTGISLVYVSGNRDGVRISWEKVGDSEDYRIYRRTKNTSFPTQDKDGKTKPQAKWKNNGYVDVSESALGLMQLTATAYIPIQTIRTAAAIRTMSWSLERSITIRSAVWIP